MLPRAHTLKAMFKESGQLQQALPVVFHLRASHVIYLARGGSVHGISMTGSPSVVSQCPHHNHGRCAGSLQRPRTSCGFHVKYMCMPCGSVYAMYTPCHCHAYAICIRCVCHVTDMCIPCEYNVHMPCVCHVDMCMSCVFHVHVMLLPFVFHVCHMYVMCIPYVAHEQRMPCVFRVYVMCVPCVCNDDLCMPCVCVCRVLAICMPCVCHVYSMRKQCVCRVCAMWMPCVCHVQPIKRKTRCDWQSPQDCR